MCLPANGTHSGKPCPRCRNAKQALLSLRYGDGMSYQQIARAMGMSLGTVKSALNRAKDALQAAAQIHGIRREQTRIRLVYLKEGRSTT